MAKAIYSVSKAGGLIQLLTRLLDLFFRSQRGTFGTAVPLPEKDRAALALQPCDQIITGDVNDTAATITDFGSLQYAEN